MLHIKLMDKGSTMSSCLTDEHFYSLVGIDIIIIICLVIIAIAVTSCGILYRVRVDRKALIDLIDDVVWKNENTILALKRTLNTLKEKVMLSNHVSEFHVFVFRYRHRLSCLHAGDVTDEESACFHTVAQIEHLLCRLHIEFITGSICSRHVFCSIRDTVNALFVEFSQVLTDEKVAMLHRITKPSKCHTQVLDSRLCDADLRDLMADVSSYVTYLRMENHGYKLKHIPITTKTTYKPGFPGKLFSIDNILSSAPELFESKKHVFMNAYSAVRLLCIKHKVAPEHKHLPLMSEHSATADVMTCLRHALRCLIERFDEELQLIVFNMFDELYWWNTQNSMFALIEGSKSAIQSLLNSITIDQIVSKEEITRQKLEDVEYELQHLLGCQPVGSCKSKRANRQASFVSFESETSVYTMAMSPSAYAIDNQMTSRRSFSPASMNDIPERSRVTIAVPVENRRSESMTSSATDIASSLGATLAFQQHNYSRSSITSDETLDTTTRSGGQLCRAVGSSSRKTSRPTSPLVTIKDYHETSL